LASALVAARMPRALLGPGDEERASATSVSTWRAVSQVTGDLRRAAAHLLQRARASDALLAIGAHRFLYGIATLTIVLLNRNYFTHNVNSGLLGLGAVVAASGVGYVVAAVITPAVTRRIGKRSWIFWMLIAAAVAIVAFGLPYQRPLLVAGGFVLGVSAQGVKISVDTTVQEEVDDSFRGRVFALYDMLFNVTYVAAAAVTATVLPKSGKSYVVMTLLAVGYLAAAVGYLTLSARHRAQAGPQPVEPPESVIELPKSSSQGSIRP
jgi:MFS family permease